MRRLSSFLIQKPYTLLIYLTLPLVFMRLWWRGRKNPGYREHLSERLGILPFTLQNSIWLHAVSLGESIAAKPLIEKLLATYPDLPMLITHTTPTGRAWIAKNFSPQIQASKLYHAYLPYDTPCFIQKFLKRTQPKILILIETELWPNLLYVTHQVGIPSLLANARLSERSFKRYQKAIGITPLMLQSLSHIAAQHHNDAQRFQQLGYPSAQISITGSMKFDMRLPLDLETRRDQLQALGVKGRPIWIAASTHLGEENMMLEAHHQILKSHSQALLLLVPRHPERFIEVEGLIQNSHLSYQSKSSQAEILPKTQVLLGDTLGELLIYYACSDIAFVGGSLKPIGGHNLLEPAALALPLLTGPHFHNFQAITANLVQQGAAQVITNAQTLAESVIELLDHPSLQTQMGDIARSCFLQNQGATDRHMAIIAALLDSQ